MDESPEPSSRVVARNTMNDIISMHAESMLGQKLEHLERGSFDVCNVVENNPLRDSISLNVE